MTVRAILIAVILSSPLPSLAQTPDTSDLLEGMLQAAGGAEGFRELGVLEISLAEAETASDGAQRNKQFTAYLDTATLTEMRLDLPGEIVVARNGKDAWATREGAIDDRPQTAKMALATLNQRLFPLLLPFTLKMDGVEFGEVLETNFEGEPAWRVAVSFPDNFFISPSMATTWYLHLARKDGSLLAAEFIPPPSVREVRAEGIRYRVLKQTTLGAGTQLPAQVLLDGIDVNGAPTAHVRITTMQYRLRGPYEPTLFLNPLELEAIEDSMD